MKWLRNAFAIEPPVDAESDAADRSVADRVCVAIVRRRLTVPSLAFLEMSRPLNYLGAQLLHFLHPLLAVLADPEASRGFARFLERRDAIDYLCRQIESLEQRASRRETTAPDARESGDGGSPAAAGQQPGADDDDDNAPDAPNAPGS